MPHAFLACEIYGNFSTAFAYPTDLFGRISRHEGVIGNVFRNDRSCADKRILANGVAAGDGAVCSQGSAFLDESRADLVHLGDFRAGIVDVREDHRCAAENTIFQGNPFKHGDVVLDLGTGRSRSCRNCFKGFHQ